MNPDDAEMSICEEEHTFSNEFMIDKDEPGINNFGYEVPSKHCPMAFIRDSDLLEYLLQSMNIKRSKVESVMKAALNYNLNNLRKDNDT